MNVFNESNDKYIRYPCLLELKRQLELSNRSKRTILNYVDGVFRFLEFSDVDDVASLTDEHFRAYLIHLHSLGLNMKTINAYNSFIRYFYLAILQYNLNPYRVPMAKTVTKPIDFLTSDQIVDLLECSKDDSRIDCIIKFGLCCGLRINEIISLKVSDVDISSMRVFVSESKRNKSRYVPIDNTLYLALQRYSREYHLKSNDYLFTFTPSKRKTNNETVRRHFYIYRDKAHISTTFTFHCLRHTFAVNHINAGGQLTDLKYLMGHGSLSATMLYVHIAYNQRQRIPSFMDSLLEVNCDA